MKNPSEQQVNFLKDKMEKASIPAISIAALSGGEVTWSTTIGIADVETKSPANENSIFWACSLSKPVFAYLVFKLMQDGRLGDFNLDTPLWRIFDDERFNNDERRKDLTAKKILSHQSGLPNETKGGIGNGLLEFESNPGSDFSYSGEGFYYLQKVIEAKTGRTLEELAKEYIFDPLGMKNSSFLVPEPQKIVENHDENMQHVARLPKINANNNNAAGSLHTTASDYALFLQACLKDEAFKEVALKTSRVSTLQDLKAQEAGVKKETLQQVDWGLGWGLQKSKTGNIDYAFHWGHGPGARHFTVLNLKDNSAIVYLTNSANGLAIVKDLVAATIENKEQSIDPSIDYLYSKYGYKRYDAVDFVVNESEKKLQEKEKIYTPQKRVEWLNDLKKAESNPVKIQKEILLTYTGKYGPLLLTLKNNALHLELFGQKHELIPINETTFASKNDLTFRLEFDKLKGQVTSHFLYGLKMNAETVVEKLIDKKEAFTTTAKISTLLSSDEDKNKTKTAHKETAPIKEKPEHKSKAEENKKESEQLDDSTLEDKTSNAPTFK